MQSHETKDDSKQVEATPNENPPSSHARDETAPEGRLSSMLRTLHTRTVTLAKKTAKAFHEGKNSK
ncbi:hypothetical protein QEH57_08935 [Pelagicoccus sp. SDUM812005]|nr:hypothetical protein [Pelagicoccus sp. SDUM812005]